MNTKEIGGRIFDRAEVMKKSSSLFDTTNQIAELELQLNSNPDLSTREVFQTRLNLEFLKKELTKQEQNNEN
jgi:hypothetical protein